MNFWISGQFVRSFREGRSQQYSYDWRTVSRLGLGFRRLWRGLEVHMLVSIIVKDNIEICFGKYEVFGPNKILSFAVAHKKKRGESIYM